MTSKNTALLDMPIAELVKEAYGKAEELKLSFPEISALLRAAAGRIDVFNALLVLSSSVNVQRYSPDYQMHLNHEMAIMRPTDKGTFVSLADYVALMNERNDLNNQLQARPVVLAEVMAERQKQIAKGYTAEHDDEHCCDEIAAAATVLVMPESCRDWLMHPDLGFGETLIDAMTPAGWGYIVPKERRENLITGIAMLVAEVERIDRFVAATEVQP